ncbi:MAG TPA: hypothetical protein VLA04_00805 [Verrucomicrobiae bacterium]|nr:hypothetical protein [Verrucomicrobiae bacterium]
MKAARYAMFSGILAAIANAESLSSTATETIRSAIRKTKGLVGRKNVNDIPIVSLRSVRAKLDSLDTYEPTQGAYPEVKTEFLIVDWGQRKPSVSGRGQGVETYSYALRQAQEFMILLGVTVDPETPQSFITDCRILAVIVADERNLDSVVEAFADVHIPHQYCTILEGKIKTPVQEYGTAITYTRGEDVPEVSLFARAARIQPSGATARA